MTPLTAFVAVGLAAVLPLVSSAAVINTPAALTQCQNVALSWTGATGGVFVTLLPGGQPAANPLLRFPEQSGAAASLTWEVDQPVGTGITIQINDQTGVINYAQIVTVQAGLSDACTKDGITRFVGSNGVPMTMPTGSDTATPVAGAAPAAKPSSSPIPPSMGGMAGNNDDDDDDDDKPVAAAAAAAVGSAANRTASAVSSAGKATASVFRNATAPVHKDAATGLAPPSGAYALCATFVIGAVGVALGVFAL